MAVLTFTQCYILRSFILETRLNVDLLVTYIQNRHFFPSQQDILSAKLATLHFCRLGLKI